MAKSKCVTCKMVNTIDEAIKHPSVSAISVAVQKINAFTELPDETRKSILTSCEKCSAVMNWHEKVLLKIEILAEVNHRRELEEMKRHFEKHQRKIFF